MMYFIYWSPKFQGISKAILSTIILVIMIVVLVINNYCVAQELEFESKLEVTAQGNMRNPRLIDGLNDVVALSAGNFMNAVLKSDGTVWTWGKNQNGLGDGITTESNVPIKMSNMAAVVALSGTHRMVVVKSDGTVWEWGEDFCSKKTKGDAEGHSDVRMVQNISGVVAVSEGSRYLLALKSDGTVWSWSPCYKDNDKSAARVSSIYGGESEIQGSPTSYLFKGIIDSVGSLFRDRVFVKIGSSEHSHAQYKANRPIQVEGISNVVAISSGGSHCLALTREGHVYSWGDNLFGQLGDGKYYNRNKPERVPGLDNVVQVSSFNNYSLALKADGTVWGWGVIDVGAPEGTPKRLVPTKIEGLIGVVAVSAGSEHLTAITKGGALLFWGWDDLGRRRNRVNVGGHPFVVDYLPRAVAISSDVGSLVLCDDGSVWSWK